MYLSQLSQKNILATLLENSFGKTKNYISPMPELSLRSSSAFRHLELMAVLHRQVPNALNTLSESGSIRRKHNAGQQHLFQMKARLL